MSLLLRILLLCALLGVSAVAIGVITASNTVPASSVGRQQATIDANALKPAACAGLNLTTLIVGTNGTGGNDLILGPPTGATLNGNGGVDCMIGGAGADTFVGNGKNNGDVCIGAGGNDSNRGNKCEFFTQ